MILGIDPGSEQSAYILWNNGIVVEHSISPNPILLNRIPLIDPHCFVAIEMIASYGMPVGREVFETCVWIGRFYQRCFELTGIPPRMVYRKDVKMYFCGTTKAKDGNIRQAIIDRFGGKAKAIGRKATPGLLYKIHDDEWAALAVTLLAYD